MKSNHKPQQIIVIIALIAFAMTACRNVDRVTPLTLSGQVSELIDDSRFSPGGTLNGVLTSAIGGEGTVINGQMNFTIGIPDPSLLQSVEEFFHVFFDPEGYNYTNVIFSVPEAKAAFFNELNGQTENGEAFIIQRVGTNSDDGLLEAVSYIFVDRDITITAEGRAGENGYILVFDNIELQFQRGWNVLFNKVDFFDFPFLVSLQVISRNGSPYDGLIWLR